MFIHKTMEKIKTNKLIITGAARAWTWWAARMFSMLFVLMVLHFHTFGKQTCNDVMHEFLSKTNFFIWNI